MGFSRQERTVVWVAISFSRGSCRPRGWTSISYTGRWILYHWATREAPMIQPVLCKVRPKRWQGGADSGSPLSLPHCCVRIELSFFLVIVQSPRNCSPPGSSVHGDSPGMNSRVGCHALLHGIFLIHGSNRSLLHCRWTFFYQLSYSIELSFLRQTNRSKFCNGVLLSGWGDERELEWGCGWGELMRFEDPYWVWWQNIGLQMPWQQAFWNLPWCCNCLTCHADQHTSETRKVD